jgi:hypothetical protein
VETRRKETTRRTKMGGDNTKVNLGETEWGGVDWSGLAQDRYQWRPL